MQIHFHEPDDIPRPPTEVRIRELALKVYPDGRRVRIYLTLTPFLQRPNAELTISNALGGLVSNISIIETIDPVMEFTMHIREANPGGQYMLEAVLFYRKVQEQDEATQKMEAEITIVDQTEIGFEIP